VLPAVLCFALFIWSEPALAQRYEDLTTRTPLGDGQVLIIGFLGGREHWDNETQGVRKLALKLRAMKVSDINIETIENRKRSLAIDLIRNAFDRDRDGQLNQQERASARLILYGQSFGGAAVVKLARQLSLMGVPVLLTIQVDSVGRGDDLIPANVALAANLFQRNGVIIRGEPTIRPEDPARTKVLGNFEFDYSHRPFDLSAVPWYKKIFRIAHTKMDHDPAVWGFVEKLILQTMSRKNPPARVTLTGSKLIYLNDEIPERLF
jgi:hypothetical protein